MEEIQWLDLDNLPGHSQNHCLKMKQVVEWLQFYYMETSPSGPKYDLAGTSEKGSAEKKNKSL